MEPQATDGFIGSTGPPTVLAATDTAVADWRNWDMSDSSVTRQVSAEPSSWAIGWTAFAGIMMIMGGIFHAIAGLAALVDDEFYVVTRNYVFEFDITTWGWIHLVVGIIVAFAGAYLFTGSVLARTVGVIIAVMSVVIGFAWMPYYPIWGIAIVAIGISVIWALTAHGRDIVEPV
jgi:hypothetical protein